MKQKILSTVDNALYSKGKDLLLNSQYIATNLSPGNWSVLITTPSNLNSAGYECRVKEYWAWLSNYGVFGWSYYIVRSN